MKRVLTLLILVLVTGFLSCRQKEVMLSKKEIKAKADSIISTRVEELTSQSVEDLEKRQAIEVKAKADSIVEAYMKLEDSLSR